MINLIDLTRILLLGLFWCSGVLRASKIAKSLAVIGTDYPLKILDADTKRISLDFDLLATDDEFPSKIFYPKDESIYVEKSWQVPLHEPENPKNYLNLALKMNQVRGYLNTELVDNASSFSWISDKSMIINYIDVISVSLAQLAYLISRLEAGSGSTDSEATEFIYQCSRDHLTALHDFTANFLDYSGSIGLIFQTKKVSNPTKYIESLFALRLNSEKMQMSDEMFSTFVDFFFEAHFVAFDKVLLKLFVNFVNKDRWLPLPIRFFLNHREVDCNLGLFSKIIEFSSLKAFSCENSAVNAGFDSRNLVELGRLLQQGMVNVAFLKDAMASMQNHGLTSNFRYDSSMLKFLNLAFSGPVFLPSDPETAAQMGSFALPFLQCEIISDRNKIALIKEIWQFFLGDSADFSQIKDEEYTSLCLLIQRLDSFYPGISDHLWSVVKGTNEIVVRLKSVDIYNSYKYHVDAYNEHHKDPVSQGFFIKSNFDFEMLFYNPLVDTKTIYLLFEFFTDVIVDSLEAFSDETDEAIQELYAKLIEHSLTIIDWFLTNRASKAVISHWYKEFDFVPTRIFDSINDLWVLDRFMSFLNGCLILEKLPKLVDNHPVYARSFMRILISKTNMHKEPALSAKLRAPKCLLCDPLITEYYLAILDCNESELSGAFFYGLSAAFASNEVSLTAVEMLLRELRDRPNLKFATDSHDFSAFFNPDHIITLTKMIEEGQMNEEESARFIRIVRLYLENISLKSDRVTITSELLRNLSGLVGEIPFITGIVIEEVTAFDPLIIPESDHVDCLGLSVKLIEIFHAFLTVGLPKKLIEEVFLKMIVLAKQFRPTNDKVSGSTEFKFAFNCVMSAILRLKDFVMPSEGSSSMALYEFYHGVSSYVSNSVETLVRSLKQQSSIIAIYDRIMDKNSMLPYDAFELAPLNCEKNLKIIHGIQLQFMKMLTSTSQYIDLDRMKIIIEWIQKGSMKPENFIKFLQTMDPKMNTDMMIPYIPVIYAFIASDLYTEAAKLSVLKTAFSSDNDELIRNLYSSRTSPLRQQFVDIFSFPAGKAFMELCTDAVWYYSMKRESEIAVKRKFALSGERNLANYAMESYHYLSEYFQVHLSALPDMPRRRTFVSDVDTFLKSLANLTVYGPRKDTEALKSALMFIVFNYWELCTGYSFFKVYLNTESHVFLLKSFVKLFTGDYRLTMAVILLVEATSLSENRVCLLQVIPSLVSAETFVLSYPSLKAIISWFNSPTVTGKISLEGFMRSMVKAAVSKANNMDKSENQSKVLYGMLTAFNGLYNAKMSVINSLDEIICAELFEFKLRGVIENNKELLKYFRNVLETMHVANNGLLKRMMNFLSEYSNLYMIDGISWNVIWSRLKHLLPGKLHFRSEYNVLLQLGDYNSTKWKRFIDIASKMTSLSARIRMQIYVGLLSKDSEAKSDFLLLDLLPGKLLKCQDFFRPSDISRVVKSLENFIEVVEEADESGSSFGVPTLKKFLVLMDLEVQTGLPLVWTWYQIFRLLRKNQLPDLELELVLVLMDHLLSGDLVLLRKSVRSEYDILNFIFELAKYQKYQNGQIDQVMSAAIEIYNDRFGGKSLSLTSSQQEICRFATSILGNPIELNDSSFAGIYSSLEELNGLFDDEFPLSRQDELAVSGFKYIYSLITALSDIEDEDLSSQLTTKLADLILQVMCKLLKRGNIIGFARSSTLISIEAFIISVSEYISPGSVPMFTFVVGEMIRFARFDAIDFMFQSIAYETLRKDVCLFTREIVQSIKTIDLGYQGIASHEWPIEYLSSLASSDGGIIHEDHFKMIEFFLDVILFKDVRFAKIFQQLELIVKRKEPCHLISILNLVEGIIARFPKMKLELLYTNFLTESTLRNLLEFVDNALLLKFLKDLKKLSLEDFENWIQSTNVSKATVKRLNALFQAEMDSKLIQIHTALAETMIRTFGDFSLSDQLTKYRNLNVSYVGSETLLRLGEALIGILKQQSVPSLDGLKLAFSVKIYSAATYEDLLFAARRGFNDELFVFLVDSADRNSLEGFKQILSEFKEQIQLNHLKLVRAKLRQYNLFDDMDLLVQAAFNSDTLQGLEYYQNVKGIDLPRKLALMNSCNIIVCGADSISKLLTSIRSGIQLKQTTTEADETTDSWIRFILENFSLSFVFTSASRTNAKNKSILVSLLKANLTYRKATELGESIISPIGRTILNLYFKPSSYASDFISGGPIDSWAEKVLLSFWADHQSGGNSSAIIKCFRMLHEIEEVGLEVSNRTQLLNSMIDALYAALNSKTLKNHISSPQIVSIILRLLRTVPAKKVEKKFITNKLLKPSNLYRTDCFAAYLKVQADLGLDVEFFNDIKRKSSGNGAISRMIHEFEYEMN